MPRGGAIFLFVLIVTVQLNAPTSSADRTKASNPSYAIQSEEITTSRIIINRKSRIDTKLEYLCMFK